MKRVFRPVLILVLMTVLVISLTACGLFQDMNKIKSVSIEQISSWTDENSDGIYEAELGKYITLEVKWDNTKIKTPPIKWYIQEDGREKKEVEGATEKELKYKLTKRGDTVYTFSASAGDIESKNTFRFVVVDAKLDAPTISCTNPGLTLAQGVIQQNLMDTVEDVNLKADSNFDDIAEDIRDMIEITWKVNGEVQIGATTNEFTYDVSGITDECQVTVTCELNYDGLEAPKSTSIVLDFIKNYKMVQSVSVVSSAAKIEGTKSAYLVEGTNAEPGSITISAEVTPLTGTNLASPCTWTKADKNGESTLIGTGRSINADLSFGKNVFTATVDNVKSRQITVYSLDNATYLLREPYIKDTFIWNGSENDHYINSQNELNSLVGYIVSTHNVSVEHGIFLSNPDWKNGGNATEAFKSALSAASNTGVDESGAFSFTYTAEKISLSKDSKLGEPKKKCVEGGYIVTQANVRVRYDESAVLDRASLPVDSFSESMEVSNSNQLFRAVSWGYKPVISSSNTDLKALYQEARKVLLTYCEDGMSELEKVKIIYDWIVNNIDYDTGTLHSVAEDKTDYNAFYLEGVFNDHLAVCDGKSKAFALLCGMEGIKAERIMGYADKELGNKKLVWESGVFTPEEKAGITTLKSGTPATANELGKLMAAYGWGHAWNKVLIDADGDGIREWYVVDATWGDVSMASSTFESTEYLSYDYFLVRDEDVENNHYSNQVQNAAVTAYNPFADEFIGDIPLEISTQAEFDKLVEYCKLHVGRYILIKIGPSVNPAVPGISRITSEGITGMYIAA